MAGSPGNLVHVAAADGASRLDVMDPVGQSHITQASQVEKLILWHLSRPSAETSRRWIDRGWKGLEADTAVLGAAPPTGHPHPHRRPFL